MKNYLNKLINSGEKKTIRNFIKVVLIIAFAYLAGEAVGRFIGYMAN